MNCPSCGGRVEASELRCRYCGKLIPQSSAAEKRTDASQLPGQTEELEKLLRYTPSATGVGAGHVFITIFGLIFTSFAVFFIVTARRHGAPVIFQVFPLIFVLVGLAMVGGGVRGLVRLATSPLHRLPARVIGKRQEDSSTTPAKGARSTTYYVTIETEDGQRKEHSVRGSLYGQLERGDAGVAYMKGGFLIDFRPVGLPRA